ncbi:MAG TPA: 3'(2'),5'-bisphosphate nucleotidase CysQ [Bacteroidales bacterium]|nr:3'(2'),5'-bisphosphate nucleotidase CysQ [Bacteroidales bacterium]
MDKSYIKYLNVALTATLKAGAAILDIYRQGDFQVEMKADCSPLTLADRRSHQIITDHLRRTDLPVLSEEGKEIPYGTRKNWELFWLVDPLDGTKEFISRNGEFTVNIALIHQQNPVAGLIFAPVPDLLYAGIAGKGSYRMTNASGAPAGFDLDHFQQQAEALPLVQPGKKFTTVASRSHSNEKTQTFLEALRREHGEIEIKSGGSSLKFCLIAEGSADVYPRFGPTCEWDTGAGQAIVEAAGGRVCEAGSGKYMLYNKQNLLNPGFITYGSR